MFNKYKFYGYFFVSSGIIISITHYQEFTPRLMGVGILILGCLLLSKES